MGLPPKPEYFSGIAAREWDRLSGLCRDLRVLTVADGPILEATVLAYEDLISARAAAEKGGRFYASETETGALVRQHPALAVGAEAWRRYVMALSHFGLSPATRSKVSTTPERDRAESKLDKYWAESESKLDEFLTGPRKRGA